MHDHDKINDVLCQLYAHKGLEEPASANMHATRDTTTTAGMFWR